jgi:hypothetical protein
MLVQGQRYWTAFRAWTAAWTAYAEAHPGTPEWVDALHAMQAARARAWGLNYQLLGRCYFDRRLFAQVKDLTKPKGTGLRARVCIFAGEEGAGQAPLLYHIRGTDNG